MGNPGNPWAVMNVSAPTAQTVNATAAPPTTSAAPAADPWEVKGVTAPAATNNSGGGGEGLGGWADRNFSNPNGPAADQGAWGIARGGIKSAGQVVGNILDFFSKPRPIGDNAPETQTPLQQRTAQHLQDAAQWLKQGGQPEGFWENVGAVGEQVLELVGTEGLLKLVGPGAKIARAGSRVIETTEQLKQAQQVAGTLSQNPKIAGLVALGLKASKDAATIGAQTYAHTEDPTQAAEAAAFGGVVSGGVGIAARGLAKIAPRTVAIGGEQMPALADQLNEAGKPMDTGARGAPAVARAQQQGAQNVIRNTAAQATATALDKINQTRPVYAAIGDTGRMLTAGEAGAAQAPSYAYSTSGRMSTGAGAAEAGGGSPFTFTLEGAPEPTSTTTGPITTPAEEIPRTHTSMPAERSAEDVEQSRIGAEPEYIQPSGPGGAISERTGRSWVERRTPGYMHTNPAVEGPEDVAGGGGNLQTTDPGEAEGWLRQLEDIQAAPEYGQLPQGQQSAIEAQRQKLTEQLGLYHSSPYAQRFAPVDIGAAAGSVRTFGDAATQIEAAAKPVYNTLDRVSGGEFNKWKEIAKRATTAMRSPGSEEAFQNAQTKYNEAQGEINDLIDRHRGQVSTQDYMTAKNAWRDSSRLNELHGVFEGMMNGVTAEESDQGLTRVMTGRAKRLESYLGKDTNREQLEQLIGKDGITNLKQITLLLSKANTSRATQDVAKNTLSELYGHARMGGAGGAIGGMVAHTMGVPWYEGMVAGATTAEGIRMVLRYASTSPRVGNMVEYAVRNGLNPQHYAPLIARTIAEPFQQQEEAPNDAERTGTQKAQ